MSGLIKLYWNSIRVLEPMKYKERNLKYFQNDLLFLNRFLFFIIIVLSQGLFISPTSLILNSPRTKKGMIALFLLSIASHSPDENALLFHSMIEIFSKVIVPR